MISTLQNHQILHFLTQYYTILTTTITTPTLLSTLTLTLTLTITIILIYHHINKPNPPLPPGPPAIPLLGNLPFPTPNLHHHFTNLSKTYGPIIKLHLGTKLYIIISSPSLAKQILKQHDSIFANRDPPTAIASNKQGVDIVWNTYGPEWRKLRKLFVHETMSKPSLERYMGSRRVEVREMVREVKEMVGLGVEVREHVVLLMLNVMMKMLWGGCVRGEERRGVGKKYGEMVDEFVELMGTLNVSDLFPVVGWLDLQGVGKRMSDVFLWFQESFESFVERREDGREDFMGMLMDEHGNGDDKSSLSYLQVKALLMDIVLAATHTTPTTIEWAMTQVLNNPETMTKAIQELDTVVGRDNIVEESHLPNLHYLSAIIKETFRLHPPLPFLLPRIPTSKQTISDYTIPKDSTVLVNIWAIQRDPEIWENPEEFRPERFIGDGCERGDYQGLNFNLLPFGSGRRICPGIPLGDKMVHYVLATFLHSFEWKLVEGTKLDFSDKYGISMKKVQPLVAVPSTRLPSPHLYL